MSQLGQYLQSRGIITRDQLEEALSHQAVHGARLGTNLVELGYMSIEQLADCLSDLHKTPLPQRKWLEKPQRAAAQRATRSLVERIRFIPMRLEGKVLHAAVLDPHHPTVLDDLRFATGCRIEPYVLPEIWMHDWLLELFKLPRGIRHVETKQVQEPAEPNAALDNDFATRIANARAARGQPAAPQATEAPRTAPTAQAAQGKRKLRARTETVPMHEQTLPDFNPSMPNAPPFFETTAMSHAQATAQTAKQSMRATPPPKPIARLPRLPGQLVSKLADSAIRPPSGEVPHEVAAQAAASHAAANPIASPPASAVFRPPPVSPAATSVRPPPMPVRTLTALSSIEEESWGMPAPVRMPSERPDEPTEPSAWSAHDTVRDESVPPDAESAALRSSPVPRELVALAPEHEPEPERSEPPQLPELYPAAHEHDIEIPALEPMAVARELSHWESALLQAADRERLIALSFSIAGCFATRVALFTVHQGKVEGMRSFERGIAQSIEGLLVPLDTPCMLTEVATRNEAMRARPGERPIDARVREVLADDAAEEVVLFPVAIKQRVVNVLYASNGGEPLGPVAFGALQLVAQQMGLAYGRLILTRKAHNAG